MTQTRMSISISDEVAAQIRQLAAAAGTTVSGWLEGLAAKEIDRDRRTRELLERWDAADAAIFAKAASLTNDELWHDTPPLPEAEARELAAQLDDVEAAWRDENP